VPGTPTVVTAAGSLNHLRLSVRDPAVSEPLYDAVLTELGWTQIPRDDGGRAWERHDPAAGQQWLILTPVADRHRDAPPHDLLAPGFHHLALNAADREQVRRVHEVLVGLGAEILDPPGEHNDEPGYYAVFFRDPDGFKLEVVHIS
jgi:catechol 2,3-dioxygenase-like lactoylglutathione lyase family enzyme